MSGFEFNPFTGEFDLVGGSSERLPSYARIPLFAEILTDSIMKIEAGGAVQIFSKGLGTAQGLVINKSLTVKSDSSFIVESGSVVTAVGA